MNHYLSEHRIWLRRAPEIRDFEGKAILIVDGESEYQSRLMVSYDQDGNFNSEKCSVSVDQVVQDESLWETPLPDTMPPPSPIHHGKHYLSQAAVDLIRDASDELHGELVLMIPQE